MFCVFSPKVYNFYKINYKSEFSKAFFRMRSISLPEELKPSPPAGGVRPRVDIGGGHAAPPAPRVEIIRDAAEIARLEGEWGRLLRCTPHASFFQSLAWLRARCRTLGAGDRGPRVAAVYDGRGVLTGLVPLVVEKKATPLGEVRKLRFPVGNWGSFYGPVGPRPVETLRAAADHLLSSKNRGEGDFDVFEFTTLPGYRPDEDSGTGGVPPVASAAGTGEFSECSHVAMLSLEKAGSWDAYWDSRRVWKNRRRNVERCERRLGELGEIRHVRHRPAPGGDPRWDLYEACEKLAARSWQDGLTDGDTLHHPAVRTFYRESYQAAVEDGAADLNLLTLGGDPVAFVFGYHYRGYVDLVRIGFDPRHARLAPGNALWTRLIRDSFERGDRILDFGPSCLDYKQFWMTGVETSYQIIHYAPTATARAFRLARRIKKALPYSFASADHTNRESKERAGNG